MRPLKDAATVLLIVVPLMSEPTLEAGGKLFQDLVKVVEIDSALRIEPARLLPNPFLSTA